MSEPLGNADDRLLETLLAWEEAHACGNPISLTSLCNDPGLASELEQKLDRLKQLDRFLYPATDGETHTAPESMFLPHRRMVFPNVPGYEILEEIGRGGMGIVYKARQHSLERFVAMKTLVGRSWAQPDFVARLRREARALSQLNDPHIVQVFDVIETADAVSIVLQYVEGENLSGRLNGSPFSPMIAAHYALTLARTLTTVHSQGLLHRDIKPANVLIDRAGKILIADFGLVKEVGSTRSLTVTGDLFGSPSYMAPEQAAGRDVDARTDVYGLGATLYEMLTGHPPFAGTSTVETLNQVLDRDPVAPRLLNPGIPRDIETICLKCLEKDPKRRFETAKDLTEELSRFLKGKAIHSRPIGRLERFARWCRRRPAAAGLMGLSIAAALVIVSIFEYGNAANQRNLQAYNQHLQQLNNDLSEAANNAKRLQAVAEENERQAKDALYVADIKRAAVAWRQEDTRELIDLLDRHVPQPGEIDRRGFEWRFLRRLAILAETELLKFDSAIYAMCYSPDRRMLAAAGKDAIVKLFDPETGRVFKQFATSQIEINGIAFSPDQTELATTGDDGTIRIILIESGKQRLQIQTPYLKVFQLVYTSDGSRIIACGVGSKICIFDAHSGDVAGVLEGHTATVENLVSGSDGKTIVSVSNDESARIWNLDGKTKPVVFESAGHVEPLIFDQERGFLITGTTSGIIRTIDIHRNREIGSIAQIDRIASLALHPNGSLLATGDAGGRIRLRKLDDAGNFVDDDFQPWQGHRGSVHALVWSNDGSRLISAGKDGRILCWKDTSTERTAPKRYAIDQSESSLPKASNDFLLALGLSKGTVTNWDFWAGRRPATKMPYGFLMISPDGRFAAALQIPDTLRLFGVSSEPNGPIDQDHLGTYHSSIPMNDLSFSSDSRSVIVRAGVKTNGQDPDEVKVVVLQVPDLDVQGELPYQNMQASEVSPDGRGIAISNSDGLTLWDLSSQQIIWRVPQSNVWKLVFSPDGKFIGAIIKDRTVMIRKVDDGAIQTQLTNHRTFVSRMVFSADGKTVVTACMDGTIKFNHMATGQELLEFPQLAVAERLEFTKDGKYLVCEAKRVGDTAPRIIMIFDGTDPANSQRTMREKTDNHE